jgi:hypothetical protein
MLSTFPFSSQVLTGLFLNVTTSGPGDESQTYQQTILDRIGYAAREGRVPPSISVDPTGPPAVTDFDLVSLEISPSLQPESTVATRRAELAEISSLLADLHQVLGPA